MDSQPASWYVSSKTVVKRFGLLELSGRTEIVSPLQPQVKPFLAVGLCGMTSTFSTFSNETLTLFKQAIGPLQVNIGGHL